MYSFSNPVEESIPPVKVLWYIDSNYTGGTNMYHCCCDGNGTLCWGAETQITCTPGGIFDCLSEYTTESDLNVQTHCDDCCALNNGNPCA